MRRKTKQVNFNERSLNNTTKKEIGSINLSIEKVKKKRYSVNPESTPKVKSLKPLKFNNKTITTETSRENLNIGDKDDES